MKAREGIMGDGEIDWTWLERYLPNLDQIKRERTQMVQDAQSIELKDVTMLERLCSTMATYDSACRERERISIRRYECQHALRDAEEIITELKATLERRVGEFTNEVKQTILKTASKIITPHGQPEHGPEEALQACVAYSAAAKVLSDVPTLQSQFQQYYLDLARFSFIIDEQVYTSLCSEYCRAERPEEVQAAEKKMEETIVQPFQKTRASLQRKYGQQYAARNSAPYDEYKILDVELPSRWQELVKEAASAASNPRALVAEKKAIVDQTAELERQYERLQAPALTEEYGNAVQSALEEVKRSEEAEKALFSAFSSSSTSSRPLYVRVALRQQQQAREQVRSLPGKVDQLFQQQLQESPGAERQEYLSFEELRSAEEDFQRIDRVLKQFNNQGLLKDQSLIAAAERIKTNLGQDRLAYFTREVKKIEPPHYDPPSQFRSGSARLVSLKQAAGSGTPSFLPELTDVFTAAEQRLRRAAEDHFRQYLQSFDEQDYVTGKEVENALQQLQGLEEELKEFALSSLSLDLCPLGKKLESAQQAYKMFSSPAEVQSSLAWALTTGKLPWPADETQQKAYARLIGHDQQGTVLPGSFWSRVRPLGLSKHVEVLAWAHQNLPPIPMTTSV